MLCLLAVKKQFMLLRHPKALITQWVANMLIRGDDVDLTTIMTSRYIVDWIEYMCWKCKVISWAKKKCLIFVEGDSERYLAVNDFNVLKSSKGKYS